MTTDEIAIVAKIMLTADSWCSTCQHGLLDQLRRAFPEHGPVIDVTIANADGLETAWRAARERWEDAGYVGPEPGVWEIGSDEQGADKS